MSRYLAITTVRERIARVLEAKDMAQARYLLETDGHTLDSRSADGSQETTTDIIDISSLAGIPQ